MDNDNKAVVFGILITLKILKVFDNFIDLYLFNFIWAILIGVSKQCSWKDFDPNKPNEMLKVGENIYNADGGVILFYHQVIKISAFWLVNQQSISRFSVQLKETVQNKEKRKIHNGNFTVMFDVRNLAFERMCNKNVNKITNFDLHEESKSNLFSSSDTS